MPVSITVHSTPSFGRSQVTYLSQRLLDGDGRDVEAVDARYLAGL